MADLPFLGHDTALFSECFLSESSPHESVSKKSLSLRSTLGGGPRRGRIYLVEGNCQTLIVLSWLLEASRELS